MKADTPSPEERIREAARQVFLAKGYDGTTSRDIAEASGQNVAMTNYYFRSKEKLFQLTFDDLHREFQAAMGRILTRPDTTLRERLLLLIEAEFNNARRHPDMPLFIMYEMRRNPELFPVSPPPGDMNDTPFAQQVRQAAAAGEIPAISPLQLILFVMANATHLFIARSLLTAHLKLSDDDFTALVDQYEQTVKDIVLGYLFGKEKKG